MMNDPSYRDATEQELIDLKRGVDRIPSAVWLIALAGAIERFTFYAVTGPWQNYIQNSPGDALPGALGLGQARATTIFNAFVFLSYLTPMPMAIIADTRLGRFKTISIGILFYMCGLMILFVTSLPYCLRRGAGIPGLAISMVCIAVGVGSIKANIAPFMLDQYPLAAPKYIKPNKGNPYVGDRTMTIQYIYNVYYWFVNIAGLSSIATTWLEKTHDFWSAYLLSWCSLGICVLLLFIQQNRFIRIKPQGNVLLNTAKILTLAAKSGFSLDHASPSYQRDELRNSVPWEENFVAEIQRGLVACRVIICFCLFELGYSQIQNNLVSQAGQMQLNHVPNDLIQVFNPVACILLGPVIQGMYRLLHKRGVAFHPIARIIAAFFFMAIAMGYASGVQGLIYSTGPCYDRPSACPESDNGRLPNNVSVWVQLPVHFIMAISEIFAVVTIMEYAYSKAPEGMKSIIQAFSQLSNALGRGLGMAISPLAKDPHLIAFYASLAAVMVLCSVAFWFLFFKYDAMDEKLNETWSADSPRKKSDN